MFRFSGAPLTASPCKRWLDGVPAKHKSAGAWDAEVLRRARYQAVGASWQQRWPGRRRTEPETKRTRRLEEARRPSAQCFVRMEGNSKGQDTE